MTDQPPIPQTQDQADAEAPDDEADLLAKFTAWDKQRQSHWGKWRDETRESFDMVAGKQWDDGDEDKLKEQGRIAPTFNRIGPMIDAVSGAEITGRQEVMYYPRTPGASAMNEVLTQGAKWIRDRAGADQEESDALRDCLICGLGWTETRLDYEEDSSGKIVIDRVDPMEVWADPSARKANLIDARYICREKKMPRDEFEELFPGEDPESAVDAPGLHNVDPKQFYNGDDDQVRDDEVKVREYQWFEKVTRVLVEHPVTKQLASATPDEFDEVNQEAQKAGIKLRSVQQQQRVYYRAFVAGNTLLKPQETLPTGEFTLKAITGKRDRNKGTWYGLVRPMKDPQRWSNQFLSQILAILATTAKGGVILEADAVEDIRKFEDSWADPRKVTIVPPGTLSRGAIQPKPTTPYPQGIDRLMQMSNQALTDVTGVNEEILGLVERDQPGVLEYQRKQAAYGILACFFDSLKRYRELQGGLLMKLMRYLPKDTLIRIVDDNGLAAYVPLALDPNNDKFDVIVDEASDGPDQKERVWQMVGQMMPLLQNANLPPSVWAKIVQYSPLPSSLAGAIAQALTGAGQPAAGGQPGQVPQGGQAPQGQPGQQPQPGPNGQPPAPAPQDIMAAQESDAKVQQMRASAAKDFAQAQKFGADTTLSQVRAAIAAQPTHI